MKEKKEKECSTSLTWLQPKFEVGQGGLCLGNIDGVTLATVSSRTPYSD